MASILLALTLQSATITFTRVRVMLVDVNTGHVL